ncbi:MAG TPA: hypothetical protein VMU05_11520 [Dongiaceae bacterium]|nr:hypothetical protein [Dongiaceae bacterium]HVO82539.1 hypothetical protein [Terriglobales bacterium]
MAVPVPYVVDGCRRLDAQSPDPDRFRFLPDLRRGAQRQAHRGFANAGPAFTMVGLCHEEVVLAPARLDSFRLGIRGPPAI